MGPETFLIAAAASAMSGVLGAVQSIQQGRAANEAAKFNARVLDERAANEQAVARQQAADERRRGSRVTAALRAGLAGSGLANAGTALLQQGDVASAVELSARRIETGGEIRARRSRQEGAVERFRGRNARRQGFMKAGASLLSGAASAGFGAAKGLKGGPDAGSPRKSIISTPLNTA